jgi:hypothetical protein
VRDDEYVLATRQRPTANVIGENPKYDCLLRNFARLEQQLRPDVRGIAVTLRNRYGQVVADLSVSLMLGKEPRGAIH